MLDFSLSINTKMPATYFNELSTHFQNKIYSGFKGKLRLAVLQRDFNLFNLLKNEYQTLDIGAGQGQFSSVLADHGHNVTLLEPSETMLNVAQKKFNECALKGVFIKDQLQNIPTILSKKYDLILCHAVIEWLEDPLSIIPILKYISQSNTTISLLFYNLNGLIYHNLIRGNYHYIERQNFSGETGGLTPLSPIDPLALENELYNNGFEIYHKSGIRTYYDFMTKENRTKINEDDHLKMELNYSSNPLYLPHARYLHWLIKKTDE